MADCAQELARPHVVCDMFFQFISLINGATQYSAQAHQRKEVKRDILINNLN